MPKVANLTNFANLPVLALPIGFSVVGVKSKLLAWFAGRSDAFGFIRT